MWPLDQDASNLQRTLCACELAIHELDGCVSGLIRETQGAFSTRSARPSRSYACFGVVMGRIALPGATDDRQWPAGWKLVCALCWGGRRDATGARLRWMTRNGLRDQCIRRIFRVDRPRWQLKCWARTVMLKAFNRFQGVPNLSAAAILTLDIVTLRHAFEVALA